MELFAYLVLAYIENWSCSIRREQEQIALCIIYVERIGICSPIVNEICELTSMRLSVSNTESAQGERYRSSEFVLIVLSVSCYFFKRVNIVELILSACKNKQNI